MLSIVQYIYRSSVCNTHFFYILLFNRILIFSYRLRNTGEFYLSSEGKRPIFVDGRPITAGNKVRLYDNAVVEISCLRFIFSVNHDLIRAIHNESIRYNIPP